MEANTTYPRSAIAANESNPSQPVSKEKSWSVGTLTYTTGGLVALFATLLFGDFSWQMRDRSVTPMAQWFLTTLKIPNVWFGYILNTFPALIAIILNPIISVKSDRYRSRRGRRVPFLLICTPIAALGMIGISVSPYMGHWLHSILGNSHPFGNWLQGLLGGTFLSRTILPVLQSEKRMMVLCFVFFWTAFELGSIAAWAVFQGLINDVVPRQFMGRFFGLFRAISLIDGVFFSYCLMGLIPVHFTLILAIIGCFYGLTFVWVCFRVKEGEYPPPSPREGRAYSSKAGSSWTGAVICRWWLEFSIYLKECFSNYYYISVFILIALLGIAPASFNIFVMPYRESVNLNMEDYGHYQAGCFVISACLAYFLGYFADKIHPLRMAVVTMTLYAMVMAWGSIYATNLWGFKIAWLSHVIISGCIYTSTPSLGQRLFPHTKFAQFASAASIVLSLANMVIGPIVGKIIDHSGRDYRMTFVCGFWVSIATILAAINVYIQFRKLGGPNHYVAPGET